LKTKKNKTENNDNSKKDKDISDIYDWSDNRKYKPDKLAEVFSLPQGTFKNFPTIQIRGNREITIDGCTGLLSYKEENILLETKYCRINIVGRTLSLSNLTKNILSIKGFIKNVEFTM